MNTLSKIILFINKNPYTSIIILIFLILIGDSIIFLLTKFKKTIIIKNKYITSNRSLWKAYVHYNEYIIVDTENNIYKIEGPIFLGLDDKETINIYNSLNVNSQYTINVYGYKINMFGDYQLLYNVENLELPLNNLLNDIYLEISKSINLDKI